MKSFPQKKKKNEAEEILPIEFNMSFLPKNLQSIEMAVLSTPKICNSLDDDVE